MGMLNLFKRNTLNQLNRRFDELVGEVRQQINQIDFNWEAAEREMNDALNRAMGAVRKHIKNLTDKFVVEVPYNRDTQILSTSFEGRMFKVVVKLDSEDERVEQVSTTQTLLPLNVVIEQMTQRYDEVNKKMVFTFKKDHFSEAEDTTADSLTTEDIEEDNQQTVNEEAQVEERVFEVEIPIVDEPCEVTSEAAPSGKERMEEIKKMMYEMYQGGAPYTHIAEEFGVSDKTVARWIKAYAEKSITDNI